MTLRPDKVRVSAVPIDQISQALGQVRVPGTLEEFCHALHREKQNVLRLRRGIDTGDFPFSTAPIPWYALGHRPIDVPAGSAARPSRRLAYAAADYYIQDAGSLLALAAASADTSSLEGLLICDLCAAPGGKASALVEAIDDEISGRASGFVLANETIRSRIGALQLNLARTGSNRYAISNLDPESLAERLAGVFDLVVVDAPCSGQALPSRGNQKATAFASHQIEHSALRQRRILDAAIRLLRDGGRLVYSTCTFAEAENETQVRRLIASGMAEADCLERLAPYQTDATVEAAGCYRLWPHLHDCAGSFAASMRVHQHSAERHRFRDPRDEKLPVDLSQWYRLASESVRLRLHDSVIFGWPSDAPAWVEEFAVSGPELAHRAGKTWKPAHAGALRRIEGQPCCRAIEVDDETAKAYVRGEPIDCRDDGWQVVRLRGRPLGWVKANRSVGKNHLPRAARMSGELTA